MPSQKIPETPETISKKQHPPTASLLVVLIVLSLTSMILFVASDWLLSQKLEQQNLLIKEFINNAPTKSLADEKKAPTQPSATPTPTATTPLTPSATTQDFKNPVAGYQISYPKTAVLTDDDDSCVIITHHQGYVKIASKEATSGCLRSVTGSKTAKTEKIKIEEKEYTASGFTKKGSTDKLSVHNETLVVTLPSGVKIEYGSSTETNYTFADYDKIREDVVTIVKSYKSL